MEKKNIDRLFQEKLKDFEAAPSNDVWNNIASKLDSTQKRKVFPLWWKLGGVAALLLGGLLLIPFSTEKEKTPIVLDTQDVLKHDENSKNTEIVLGTSSTSEQDKMEVEAQQNNNIKQKDNQGNAATNSNSISTLTKEQIEAQQKQNTVQYRGNGTINSILKTKTDKNKIAKTEKHSDEELLHKGYVSASDLKEKNGTLEDKSFIEPNLKKNENSTPDLVHQSELENKIKKTSSLKEFVKEIDSALVLQETEPNTLEELLKEKEKNFSKEPKVNRWQIGPLVAPVYFNSVSNGSPIDAEFASNAKEYQNDMAFGIGLQYAVNPKISLRTGISKVNLGYNTNDVVFFAELNSNMLRTINYSNIGNPIMVHASNTPTFVENTIQEKNQGYMNQRMGFIEMPLELSYKIIDRKFGINFIGGASSLFLIENEVSVFSNDGFSGNLGEANNINTIHFSANFGVGLEYKFLKNFQANFEPMFKYQLNTFNNNPGNFKPYFIGLYTGINYRF
ncbi:outer membrane beta-barrel protein [Flavobacterium sp. UBA6135]|uniref:outer membrane beta-barrel protein n=1 Tax=Flavobacterium sp. UBA6135 TaxID=1946553 RepID=UPI0025BCC048|nr:outer membrane beta-barrel protein [Flavobacterium sp. UBA6135]